MVQLRVELKMSSLLVATFRRTHLLAPPCFTMFVPFVSRSEKFGADKLALYARIRRLGKGAFAEVDEFVRSEQLLGSDLARAAQ